MKILGINNEMHISSACLIEDGKIVAAAAEERFTREKLTRKFPQETIKYCFKEANIKMEEVDYIATSWNPGIYFTKFNPLLSGQRRHMVEQLYSVPDNLMQLYVRPEVDYVFQEISGSFGKTNTYYITHHRAHAANGFFLSPFSSAAILTADAQGEFESTTFCHGKDNKINFVKSISYPHSLGALYSTFTEFLGFRANSDEWKVMALASYADPNNEFYKLLKEEVVKFQADGGFELNLSYFKGFLHDQPNLYTEKLVEIFGKARERDEELQERHFEIASALQKISEEAVVHLLNWLFQQTREKNLVLSGGLFMNSVFNGKVLELTPFDNLFVSSCPDDSGNCFGAALYLYNHILGKGRSVPMSHNYYGPQYTDSEIEEALKGYNLNFAYEENIFKKAAKLLSEGNVIGWFQGRMEFGQRALGNRSILADPRKADMKDKVNRAVKFRESFRPFAPAVIKEKQEEYFEIGKGGDVPFMEKVYPVIMDKRDQIPAVVHADGSGRIQTVIKELNPGFYSLIEEFEKITHIPIVLNTSFNLNGEPIVCTPSDAIKTFYSCGLDTLVIGNYIVHKGR
jgi:carbamoyltransferase